MTHDHTRRSAPASFRLAAASALALLLAAFAPLAAADIPATERQALIDLYTSTAGDGWVHNDQWKSGASFSPAGTECSWYGVTCDAGNNHVTGLNLNENNPVGTLPASISTLTALEFLRANSGHLTGDVPSLSGLAALREVSLQYQAFDGRILGLGELPALQSFHVNNNQLTGPIPDLSGAPALQRFVASNNRLSGPIPSLSGLGALQYFAVANNQLSGTPPAAPGTLVAGLSRLCPNLLHTPSPTDAAWNTATGQAPWSTDCTPGYLVRGVLMYGYGGRVGPPQGVQADQTATLELIPDTNYVIGAIFSGCGGSRAGNLFTTGPVQADCEVQVEFRAAPGTITPSTFTPGGGFVRCTPALPGESSTCTATPAAGFRLQSIEGCGGTPGATSPYVTGPMSVPACMVTVRFAAISATLADPTAVPTLERWALMLLGAVLGGCAVWRKRRAR